MSEPLVQHLQPELLLGPSARSIASTPGWGCCLRETVLRLLLFLLHNDNFSMLLGVTCSKLCWESEDTAT